MSLAKTSSKESSTWMTPPFSKLMSTRRSLTFVTVATFDGLMAVFTPPTSSNTGSLGVTTELLICATRKRWAPQARGSSGSRFDGAALAENRADRLRQFVEIRNDPVGMQLRHRNVGIT